MWFSNRHILLPGRLYGVFRTRQQCCCQDLFRSWDQDRELGLQVSRPRSRPWSSGLETETEPWTKWTRVHSSLETIWSRDHNTGCINSWYWWQSTRLKVATNYGNRATGVGTKHAFSRPIPILGLETKIETWAKWTRVHSSLETMVSRSQHCQTVVPHDVARIIVSWFLPRDAVCKRGFCCRPVSVRRSRWWIVSRWLKISSNFFLGPVAHHFNFSTPSAGTQFQGEPLQQGRKIHGAGKILRISTEIEIAVYLVEHYTK